MFPARHLVVIGKRTILHRWILDLAHAFAHEHLLQVYHASSCKEWQANKSVHHHYQCRAAIICLSQGEFLAEWISTLLTVKKRVQARMLIYIDDVNLLNDASLQLLQRVIPHDLIVYTHTCQSRIKKLLLSVIDGDVGYEKGVQFTNRELAILGWFVQGKDADWQSEHFGIARCTVFQHQKNCANKLGLRTLKDLTRIKLGPWQ